MNGMDRSEEGDRRISILLADSQALFRGGLRHLLTELPRRFSITEAANGKETVERVRSERFDLIMLECLMPDFLPVPLVTAVRDLASGTPFIVVSAAEQPEHVRAVLENGAAGFVPKTCSPNVMLHAVMLVLSGGIYIPPSVLTLVPHGVIEDQTNSQAHRQSSLTPRQHAILQYLANGYSNKQIASALSVSEGTVKSHIAGLLKVLGAKNRTHAIIVAYHNGLLQPIH